MSHPPKVSIVSISYNQDRYIEEALNSFVMQKTNFDFEVIIADDASTDKTQKIVKQFKNKHPDIIKPILRRKNIGIGPNLYHALRQAKGEYIALCEADDYWIDDKKLQIQVDFMEERKECALCFHPVRVVFQNGEEPDSVFPEHIQNHQFTIKQLLKSNFIQTNSVVYRRQSYNTLRARNALPIDWYLHLYHAQFGKIGFLDRIMSVYRRHPGGAWWDSYKGNDDIWLQHGINRILLFQDLIKIYGADRSLRPIIEKNTNIMIAKLAEIDIKRKTQLIPQTVQKFPTAIESYIYHEYHKLRMCKKEIHVLDNQNQTLRKELLETKKFVNNSERALQQIINSRTWRLRTKILKLLSK